MVSPCSIFSEYSMALKTKNATPKTIANKMESEDWRSLLNLNNRKELAIKKPLVKRTMVLIEPTVIFSKSLELLKSSKYLFPVTFIATAAIPKVKISRKIIIQMRIPPGG